MRILFATSEVYPLIKTGGLADVSSYLPKHLKAAGQDVRIVLPAYKKVLACLKNIEKITTINIPWLANNVNILQTKLPDSEVILYLIDAPDYFDRDGDVYANEHGQDWGDNALRFGLFCKAVVQISMGNTCINWYPDIIHCNDWPTGLIPALLSRYLQRPATVFTIHNLAYQGVFDADVLHNLNLPDELWSPHAMEYYSKLSYIKGGLAFADYLTTVSPNYAKEILTSDYGHGLEGLLQKRRQKLVGILNGVDDKNWHPEHDQYINTQYDSNHIADKKNNKLALQTQFGLPNDKQVPVLSCIARLVEQKGIDLILAILEDLFSRYDVQFILLGSGEQSYVSALKQLQMRYQNNMAVYIGYSEKIAHVIEAGADIFLMPSRFEPCGLNQMYSLRYGTVPIVHNTGGLTDTIIDANPDNLEKQLATGFKFNHATPGGLLWAIEEALKIYTSYPEAWENIIKAGMRQEFTWQNSAMQYMHIYQQCLNKNLNKWPKLSNI